MAFVAKSSLNHGVVVATLFGLVLCVRSGTRFERKRQRGGRLEIVHNNGTVLHCTFHKAQSQRFRCMSTVSVSHCVVALIDVVWTVVFGIDILNFSQMCVD